MSDILVKPGDLRHASSDLRQSAKKIIHSISEVDAQLRAVGPAQFSGRQADQIRTRYRSVREKLFAADDLVNQFAQKLDLLAKEFEKTDRALAGPSFPGNNFFPSVIRNIIDDWGRIIRRFPDINIPWPPKLFPLPNFDLPRPPWDPSPVYAPGPGDVVVGGDDSVVSPQPPETEPTPTTPAHETLPLDPNAPTGYKRCFDFVLAQREKNHLPMPVSVTNNKENGLYTGIYIGEGSFNDKDGKSFTYGQEPKLGAIMVQSPKNCPDIPYGHVSIVSGLDKDAAGKVTSFTISETSWGPDKSAVNSVVFTWNESKGRYVSSSGRLYDSFVY